MSQQVEFDHSTIGDFIFPNITVKDIQQTMKKFSQKISLTEKF
jgi:hypothetical protein